MNSKRQFEIDIAKGLAIVFMVLVHTTEYFYCGKNPTFQAIAVFLGGPFAAPVFMFALGVGVNYTRDSSPKHFAKRGCHMLIMSYVYNLLVYAAPYILKYFQTGDSGYLDTAVVELLNVDILQFAALTFITFAIIKKFNLNTVQIIVYAAVVSVLGQFLTYSIILPDGWIKRILGLLWGSNEASFFPYCSWIVFPLVGYVFGKVLINCEYKKRLYRKIAAVAIPTEFLLMAIAIYFAIDFGQLTEDYHIAYYHMGIYANICFLAFVFGWLSICYLISLHIPKGILAYLTKICKNITKIYVIQYILIIYSYVFIAAEENNLDIVQSVLLFALFFILSDKIADLYNSGINRWKQNRIKAGKA